MKKFIHALVLLGAISIAITTSAAEPDNSAASPSKPTVVLVHGAFADSSSWNGVIARLQSRHYPVVAVANPLRSVKGDADYLQQVLGSLSGPVVLVGHSYGGLVISNVRSVDRRIKALVYVAAFAPEAGETAAGLSGRFPGSTLATALAPPVALPGGGNDLYIQQQRYPSQFAADIPAADATAAAAGQRPITDKALNEPSGAPLWATVPSWSVYGSSDKNIPAAAMAFMAERAKSRRTLAIDGASHVVMISHPAEVADLIVEAAEAKP
ncbi:MAG: alpha/beta fold hydrolase [Pseudoxanthomonas sp.]